MFKILGSDQRVYGPVTVEQIRQWISEGRANAATMAQAEGGAEWKALSNFPEFAEALSAKGGGGGQAQPPRFAQTGASSDADTVANQVLSRGRRISPGSCITRSFNLMTGNFWLVVGATFVASLVDSAVPLLYGPMQGGLFYMFLRIIRGEKADFGDAFAGFSKAFMPLFLAGLVTVLLQAVGFLLCILPGIYLCVAWFFALPLVIDKGMEFWPAMEASRKIISGQWWTFFGLGLLMMLVIIVGLLVCYVGTFIAMPVAIGALAYAYEDIVGSSTTTPSQPR